MNALRNISLAMALLLAPAVSHALVLYADTNGDGVTDTVTLETSYGVVVKIYHPNTGRTSSYSLGSGFTSAELIGATNTNGLAGQEVVVRATASSQQLVYVVDDAAVRLRQYNFGTGFTFFDIVSIGNNTDGLAGNEIVVGGAGSGFTTVRIIDDARARTRQYDFGSGLTTFGVISVDNTDGLTGDEVAVQLGWSGGSHAVAIIDDARARKRQYNYGSGLSTFAILAVTDTDGRVGKEIVTQLGWSGSAPVVHMVDDARATTRQYSAGIGLVSFAVMDIRNYDGVTGDEVCYNARTSSSSFYRLIVDRTGSVLSRSSCY